MIVRIVIDHLRIISLSRSALLRALVSYVILCDDCTLQSVVLCNIPNSRPSDISSLYDSDVQMLPSTGQTGL
jgi:hypothetical protein